VGPDTCGFPNALLCGTTLAVAPTTPVDAAVAPAALDGTGLVRPGKKRRHGRHGAVGPILSRTGARRFASRDIHASLTVEALADLHRNVYRVIAAEQPPDTEHRPPRRNGRTIPATCTTHRSGVGFCNLRDQGRRDDRV
jgi:hypothetical protein